VLQPKVFSIGVMGEAVLLCLALALGSLHTMAQSKDNIYILILASGFLCSAGDSSTCPAAAKGNEGDSYELSGAGTFDAQDKSVKVTGTFTHKAPNGDVLETGVWVASELVRFDSYGAASNALPHRGVGPGRRPMGLRHAPTTLRPMPTGGLAVFHIRLLATQGLSRSAVLQVNSPMGEVPPEHSAEGIRLKMEKSSSRLFEEVSGHVMFLLTTPEGGTPMKAPPRDAAPASPETRSN